MTSNPFDNENGSFLVLVNHEDQHSLWPDSIPVPSGWIRVHGPAGRRECMDHVENHWRDLRPASLRGEM
ncbi:MbtH family protein [Micromonospora sp. 15K316]|uniref:MbtH family protein n=1 Tax=Micromonospora sp. 15K316 TaxID=2530376 RepID=UPI0010473D93|nr:MbtH family protein [Micromonospora sp. 15K316]TDC30239.1 MbtH family protein [Micromonospora sp. 15K316]